MNTGTGLDRRYRKRAGGFDRPMKNDFLVCWDLQKHGFWGLITARSEEEIREKYPEIEVVPKQPAWMDDGTLARIRAHNTFDIDQPPTGWLKALADERGLRP